MGAAAISRMTYHEWAGQGGAARLAVGPRPGACQRSAVGQGASGRGRVLTSRRVGSLSLMIAAPHYRSLPGLGRRKEGPMHYIEYATDDQASSPGPSPRSDRRLSCPCIAAPAAVPTRPAYKVKGEVPEGLLRRRAQEETEREAVVKVSYTRKEARRLSRESRAVLSVSAWPLRCPDWNRPLEFDWYRRPKA